MVKTFNMAYVYRRILEIALLHNIFNTKTVWGYYCEWDLCGSDQYCCGDNLCCDYVYSLWYFWVGVVFVILLLSACGGIFRYCYYSTPQAINYTLVSSDDSKSHRGRDVEAQSDFPSGNLDSGDKGQLPRGPPPPYTHSTSSMKLGHQKQFHEPSFAHYL